jgi:hypothetical protein
MQLLLAPILFAIMLCRLHTRKYTAFNQWTVRYSRVEAALAAPRDELLTLALAHGILPQYRPQLWAHLCKVSDNVASESVNRRTYAQLAAAGGALDNGTLQQIELDLQRTFSEQRDFAAALSMKTTVFDGSRSAVLAATDSAMDAALAIPGAGDVHDALRRLLRAFCVAHPELGYLQSMNFVAAFQLLVMSRREEEAAFWAFEALVTRFLRGYYAPDMGILRVDCAVVNGLLGVRMPALAGHLEEVGLDLTLFLPRWLLCVFLNCFPADITVRVWDCVLLEQEQGARALLEVSAMRVRRLERRRALGPCSKAGIGAVFKGGHWGRVQRRALGPCSKAGIGAGAVFGLMLTTTTTRLLP